jgi:hypothetical protein
MHDQQPFRLHELGDDDYFPPNRTVAVVRYDGDPDVFTALVHHWLLTERANYGQQSVLPPEPRLFRWNPDPSRTFSYLLAKANNPGRGVWLGARVQFARDTTGPLATSTCNGCEAFPGERHAGWCVFGKAITRARDADTSPDRFCPQPGLAPAPNWPGVSTLADLTSSQWSGV